MPRREPPRSDAVSPVAMNGQQRIIGAIVTLAATAFIIWLAVVAERHSLPARGGRIFDTAITLPVPIFAQSDPAWAGDRIGGSREPIASVGCALCSVAMVFSQLGVPTTPKDLNRFLVTADGYTEAGWLKWSRCALFTAGQLRLSYLGDPRYDLIDSQLVAGVPAIVKIVIAGNANHWVAIVGKRGDEYLVNDPLSGATVTLSSLADEMHALRLFARAAPP